MSFQQAAWNYKKNAILTATPEKLIVMMYDGAIQNLEKARKILKETSNKYSPSAGEALGKALAIVGELRSSLNMEKGGEIAQNLDRLYEFSSFRIMEANMNRNTKPIEETLTILRTLKEGWEGIVERTAR